MTLTPEAIRQYDREAPDSERTETATFGLGCFWGPDARFGAMDGVVRTRVGYAGGTSPDPTYNSIGDHTEVFQVEYLPEKRSFGDLLELVFRAHDPFHQTGKRQYQHIVFTDTRSQRGSLDAYLRMRGFDRADLETRVEALSTFSPAEHYHQKYSLRSKRWVTEAFEKAGYDDVDIRESPAAAKLNGSVAGNDLSEEHDLLTGGAPSPTE